MQKCNWCVAFGSGAALTVFALVLTGSATSTTTAPAAAIGASAVDAFLVTIGPEHQVYLLAGSITTDEPMPEPRSYSADDMLIYQQQLTAWERRRAESQQAQPIPVMIARDGESVTLHAGGPIMLAGQQFLLEARNGTLVRIVASNDEDDALEAVHAQTIAPQINTGND